jgi:hypothetical protein
MHYRALRDEYLKEMQALSQLILSQLILSRAA